MEARPKPFASSGGKNKCVFEKKFQGMSCELRRSVGKGGATRVRPVCLHPPTGCGGPLFC